jgi:hypothetical protein
MKFAKGGLSSRVAEIPANGGRQPAGARRTGGLTPAVRLSSYNYGIDRAVATAYNS